MNMIALIPIRQVNQVRYGHFSMLRMYKIPARSAQRIIYQRTEIS